MTVTMAAALNAALRDSLRDDDSVVIYGEDVGRLGGVFRITDGLQAEFGAERCFDTPVAESGIAGTAVGMALYGLRPVVEMQFDGFSYPALDQVISHVAKYRNRNRGRVNLPIVIRIPYGGGIGAVEHHSESPEAYYAHTAGLTVVSPSTPGDAYALLRSSIQFPDPVVFLEPKRRYWQKEEVELPVRGPALGKAVVRRSGDTATLIAYGPMVVTALEAAGIAAEEGWDLEVIDVRTLVPLDTATLTNSVAKTGRAIVIHEAPRFAGYGAEIAATIAERAFGHLAAPVLRVTGFDTPYPPAKIERHYLPHAGRILDAVAESLRY